MSDNDDIKLKTEPGRDIVIAGWCGLEGSLALARLRRDELAGRFSRSFIEKAAEFPMYAPQQAGDNCRDENFYTGGGMSDCADKCVLMTDIEGRADLNCVSGAALKAGAFFACDAGEDGILGALWELAECLNTGIDIDMLKIPLRQETVEICEFYDLNPYRLSSAGCSVCAAKDGFELVRQLESEGIPASLAGKTTSGRARIVRKREIVQYITPPKRERAQREKYLELLRTAVSDSENKDDVCGAGI